MLSHDPPMLMVSFTHKSGDARKDTCGNIIKTKEFTVNIISEPFTEPANFTSVDAPEDQDEWVGSGLTQEPSVCRFVHLILKSLTKFSDYH